MAEAKKKSKLMTPLFRLGFPALFKAKKANANAEPKFSIVMIFDKATDLIELRRAASAALVEKFGTKLQDPAFKARLKSPFRDGAEKPQWDGFGPTVIFVSASTTTPPGVVDQQVQPIIDERDIYAGCYARATVNAFAYDTNGNVGVSFGLQNIQKVRDGAPFGRTRAEDDFDAVADAEGGAAAAAPALAKDDDLIV